MSNPYGNPSDPNYNNPNAQPPYNNNQQNYPGAPQQQAAYPVNDPPEAKVGAGPYQGGYNDPYANNNAMPYNNNPGYGNPGYGPAPNNPNFGYQSQGSPVVVVHQGGYGGAGMHCMVCGRETSNFPIKKSGAVVWIWCIVLWLLTGCLCCIPFFIDSCKDTEVRCARCQSVKSVIPANCC